MRLPRSAATRLAILLFALLPSSSAGAFSIIGERSANGGFLTLEVAYGYESPAGPGVSHVSFVPFNALVPGAGGPPTGAPVILAPGTFLAHPDSTSTAKDEARVTPRASFEYGDPWGAVSGDQLSLDVTGFVSAQTSLIFDPLSASLIPADALVKVAARLEFFVDTFLEPAGTVVGSVQLPALRSLETFENGLEASVLEDGAVRVGFVDAGDAGVAVDVRAGHSYRLDIVYVARAPFGTDPPFTLGVLVPMTPYVPEPGTFVLLASGLAGLAATRRQRHARAAAACSP